MHIHWKGDILYYKNYFEVFFLVYSILSYRALEMEIKKDKIRYILKFFFDKVGNASQ